MRKKIWLFRKRAIDFRTLFESYQGWQAYAKWANSYKLRNKIKMEVIGAIWENVY